jgi:nicotinamidase-related amidase
LGKIDDPVLVVLDMQNGFVNEHSRHVIQNVQSLVRDCRSREVLVVFTRFFNSIGSPFERMIGWDKVHSAPETDLVIEFLELSEIMIDKNFYTALTPEFVTMIADNGWQTLLLCGIATESCVLKTAVDAFELGIRPIVVADACASDMGEESHQAGLLVLENLLGHEQIMTSSQLLRELDFSYP